MTLTYIQAVSMGFPTVKCRALGAGTLYTDLIWESGDQIPSKDTLDTWIAANPKPNGITLSKYEFRKLFTVSERVAIDGAPTNDLIPVQYRAILLTIAKDMEVSAEVQLNNPDVAAGVQLLETIGLIAVGRATQVLNNQAPV